MTALEGAVVLVTGGQRGIGKALVDDLLTRGAAKIYATARKPVAEHRPARRTAAAGGHRPGLDRRPWSRRRRT